MVFATFWHFNFSFAWYLLHFGTSSVDVGFLRFLRLSFRVSSKVTFRVSFGVLFRVSFTVPFKVPFRVSLGLGFHSGFL